MTSLFYPAVLGSFFYTALVDVGTYGIALGRVPLLIAYFGFLVTFSIDYLVTFMARSYYSLVLFAFDLVILFLLYLSFQTLTDNSGVGGSFDSYFWYLLAIHGLFLGWDAFVIPRHERRWSILIYDALGTAVAVLGLVFLRDSLFFAILALILLSLFSIWMGFAKVFAHADAVLLNADRVSDGQP